MEGHDPATLPCVRWMDPMELIEFEATRVERMLIQPLVARWSKSEIDDTVEAEHTERFTGVTIEILRDRRMFPPGEPRISRQVGNPRGRSLPNDDWIGRSSLHRYRLSPDADGLCGVRTHRPVRLTSSRSPATARMQCSHKTPERGMQMESTPVRPFPAVVWCNGRLDSSGYALFGERSPTQCEAEHHTEVEPEPASVPPSGHGRHALHDCEGSEGYDPGRQDEQALS